MWQETVELHVQQLGDGSKPPLVILHGLFGSGDNWRTLALQWEEDYTVYLLDQRNHGRSPHDDRFDYPALAADLNRFLEERDLRGVRLIGHSMGGKTAMEWAAHHPERLLGMVVADMAPVAYNAHHTLILEALNAVDVANAASRQSVDEALLQGGIEDEGVRQFLLKGLTRRTEGGFRWRFNLEVITRDYNHILDGVAEDAQVDVDALFLYGGNSYYVLPAYHPIIRARFPKAILEEMPGAGHWLHAEQPEVFYERVSAYFKRVG